MTDSQYKENKAGEVMVFKGYPRNKHPRNKLGQIPQKDKKRLPIAETDSFPAHRDYRQQPAPAQQGIDERADGRHRPVAVRQVVEDRP